MKGHFRTASGAYGFGGDRVVESQSHLFWAEAALSYTLPKSQQNFYGRLTAGTSVDADRFSAYRLGGYLPLVSEFPLSLPGYYFQEISARQFVLLTASYLLPLDEKKQWNINVNAGSAFVDYLPGTAQPGNWLNGVGGGVMYRSPSGGTKIMVSYGYGVDAIRTRGRGAQSIGLLMQFDLGRKPSDTSIPRNRRAGAAGSGCSINGALRFNLREARRLGLLWRRCAYGGIGRHATLRW